jgi:hypothetical protein
MGRYVGLFLIILSLACKPVAAEPSSITIPIELHENRAPFLVVDMGGKPVRLQFDLGDSTALVLQRSALDSAKAVPTGQSVKMRGIDGEFQVPTFRITHVKIGAASFTDVVARLDAPRTGYVPSQDSQGYLGTGLLKSFKILLDYRHQVMELMPQGAGNTSGKCEGTAVPFSKKFAQWQTEPLTDAQTDLGPLTLWWDTGSPASVLSKTSAKNVSSKTVTTQRLAFGGADFGPWTFQIWDDLSLPGFDGFIGHDFFANHVVCVDFPGKRIVIEQS